MENNAEIIANLRHDFMQGELIESELSHDPHFQFQKWMDQALQAKVLEPQAMNIATVANNKPSSRIVYLRGFDPHVYYFFTNYNSKKAQELLENPNACITFFWPELERQLRIEGVVSKATEQQSDDYFAKRPPENKVGAWSSPQSSVINGREELNKLVTETQLKLQGIEVTRPPFWGGYKLEANYFEFWQGRKSRLHDRICYEKTNDAWKMYRVAP